MKKAVGVICECNPLHNGHLSLFRRVKDRFPEKALVCVMSGVLVQRGEAAVLEKYARARTLLAAGADLVLELPFPYSCLSAERFAASGVHILEKSGLISHLAFGSEIADDALLSLTASRLASEEFSLAFAAARKLDKKTGFPALRERVYSSLYGENPLLSLSNASLALEYLLALKRENSGIAPVSFSRDGSKNVASATFIRTLLQKGEWETVKDLVPPFSFEELERAGKKDQLILSTEGLYPLVASALLTRPREEIESLYGAAALYDRALSSCEKSASMREFLSRLSSSRHTDSRIRRAVVAVAAGIPKEADSRLPGWTMLLAASKTGRELLREREDRTFPIFTKPAHARKDPAASAEAERERKTEILFSLALAPGRLPLPLTPAVEKEKN